MNSELKPLPEIDPQTWTGWADFTDSPDFPKQKRKTWVFIPDYVERMDPDTFLVQRLQGVLGVSQGRIFRHGRWTETPVVITDTTQATLVWEKSFEQIKEERALAEAGMK